MTERRMLAAIMFTDIEGYTRMMNERENVAMANLKMHNKIFDELSFKYAGLVIKSIGDSYLIEFPSAINAVQCAFEAQREFSQCDMGGPDGKRLKVRIAIHVGDVITDSDDVYGDGVNLASRLQSVTPGGGICLSREAYAQVKSKFRERFVSLGSRVLKGLTEPVEIFTLKEFAPEGKAELGTQPPALNVVLPESSMIRPEESPEAEPARPLSSDERHVESARAATLPAPPPAPLLGAARPTAASWIIFAGLFFLFFGGRWQTVGRADWLGCGWGAALIAATLIFNGRRGGAATALGVALYAVVPYSFLSLSAAPSGELPSFEVGLVAGFGLVAGVAALYLGFMDAQPDRRLALGLLFLSTELLMVAGCARALPEAAFWAEGIGRFLGVQARELMETGGAWRWGGFIYLYAGWRIAGMSAYDPARWSRRLGRDGRRLNWNR